MRENLQGTHQLCPQRAFPLKCGRAPYHGQGNPRDLGGKLTIQPCFLRTYLAIEGSHMTFFVLLAGHFQSLRSDGAGSWNEIVGGSRAIGIFGVSDCLLVAKFKWPPWKHTPRTRASTNEVRSSDSRASFALARPVNLLIRQSSLSWSVVSFFPLTKLPNLLNR